MEQNNLFQSDEDIETIMDVDSFEDHNTLLYNYDNISETNSQYNLSKYSLNESLMIVEEDDDNLSNSNSIKERQQLNESNSIKIPERKLTINDKIRTSNQQVPTRKNISTVVINTSKNPNLSTGKKKDSLNLEKIAIPQTDSSNIIRNSKSNNSNISIVSTCSIARPSTAIDKHPQFSSYNKTYSKSKQELKTTSSNESKPEFYMVPRNIMNSMLRKGENGESKSQSLKSNLSEPVDFKNKMYVTTSKVASNSDDKKMSKFVARMQNLPDGKFKMLPSQEKVPIGSTNVYKRNANFVKHKTIANSANNKHQVTDIIRIGKCPINSRPFVNSKEKQIFQQKEQISPGKSSLYQISKSVDFGNVLSKNKKVIPHTITSKDLIENLKNVINDNREIKMKTNENQVKCTSSGFIKLSSVSEPLIKSGKISKNNHIPVQLLSLESLNKSKTRQNLNTRGENKHLLTKKKNISNDSKDSTIVTNTDEIINVFPSDKYTSKDFKSRKTVELCSIEKETSLSEDLLNEENEVSEDDNESNKFVSCQFDYCDTLVYEPELIDNLYCSLKCKKLHLKEKNVEEPINKLNEINNPPKKPVIDRKQLLVKLENRINKRKQLLTCTHSEKMPRNNDWDELEQFENVSRESPIYEKTSPFNSSREISTPEMDDDDDIIYELKSKIEDEYILNYMDNMQFKAAPKKLFDNPFPTEPNNFEVGQRLEGIDPAHEALFCVMSIIEVCGYRIKLHFDGYPITYDFWVNADCPDLFYATWCEENSRILQPPKHFRHNFNWPDYLKEFDVLTAPKSNFASTKMFKNCKIQNKFCVGAKLEALDKLTRTLPKQLICVATVADVLGNRIRIHFDGWTDDFDYWTDITSTNIHPIRWCDNNGRSLSPPSGYNDFKGKKPFSWNEYLEETKSEPVPEDAFVRRPLRDFSIDMNIEVVDLVVPFLIRVAKVVDVKGDELKILYDGFDMEYAYWIEDDSPDIHPVGWSLKTNHPIEIPPVKNSPWSCKTNGCGGKGCINAVKTEHLFPKDCPYELEAWKKVVSRLVKTPDRLKTSNTGSNTSTATRSRNFDHHEVGKKRKCKLNTTVLNNIFKPKGKIICDKSNEHLVLKNIKLNCSNDMFVKQNETNTVNINLRKEIFTSTAFGDLNPITLAKRGTAWTRHNSKLGIPLFNTTDPRNWSIKDVVSYVEQVAIVIGVDKKLNEQKYSISNRFADQEIDGEAFLMLTQDELIKLLKIPLGLSLKLSSAITMLRQRVPVFDFDKNLPFCTKN